MLLPAPLSPTSPSTSPVVEVQVKDAQGLYGAKPLGDGLWLAGSRRARGPAPPPRAKPARRARSTSEPSCELAQLHVGGHGDEDDDALEEVEPVGAPRRRC